MSSSRVAFKHLVQASISTRYGWRHGADDSYFNARFGDVGAHAGPIAIRLGTQNVVGIAVGVADHSVAVDHSLRLIPTVFLIVRMEIDLCFADLFTG